jgi:hypothetical protein
MEFLDMVGTAPEDLNRWRSALDQFLRSITHMRPEKRLVLKSPPHTGRIAQLRSMFPGAQFIHISRDPRALFPSTVRLWKALDEAQALQVPRHRDLNEYVFTACQRMYGGYSRQRQEIPPDALCELRYEDLIDDPMRVLRQVYDCLDLGNFEIVEPRIDAYLRGRAEYRASQYQLPADLEEEITRRWAFYFEMFGY